MQVFKHYFEELEEESLRDNFVVVVSTMVININITYFLTFNFKILLQRCYGFYWALDLLLSLRVL